MIKTFYILIFLFSTSFSQSDSLKSLFPLQVGNLWQYKITHVFNYDTVISNGTSEVLKDTLLEGNKYFVINSKAWPLLIFDDDTLKYLMYDSLNKSIVRYSFLGEETFFKLDAIPGDCWENVCCSLVDTVFVFGEYRIRKEFGEFDRPQVWVYSVVEDLGPISTLLDDSWSAIVWTRYDLVYARINGIEYGNYVTDVNNESEKPNSFLLLQNYPNPFNPITKIKYQIPHTGFVSLKVYDLLGREVATLVNEEKTAGNYEVEFDGSEISSGIYFYQLQSGSFLETKKLILIE